MFHAKLARKTLRPNFPRHQTNRDLEIKNRFSPRKNAAVWNQLIVGSANPLGQAEISYAASDAPATREACHSS